MTSFRRQHPGPWTVEQIPAPGYVVKDAGGAELAFIYADPDPQSANARFRMTMPEAKALADAIAALGG
jgi:hypothetical protein